MNAALRPNLEATSAAIRQYPLAGPGPLSSPAHGMPSRLKCTRTFASGQDASAGRPGGFFRQLQSSLPIVGLLSKLMSTTGLGVEDMSYAEFSRKIYDANVAGFQDSAKKLEELYGRPAQLRYVLVVLWMARLGGGLIAANHIPKAAQRLRVSFDLEIEIERFLVARDAKLQEYGMARPQAKVQEQACIALDSLCRLAPGMPMHGKLMSVCTFMLDGCCETLCQCKSAPTLQSCPGMHGIDSQSGIGLEDGQPMSQDDEAILVNLVVAGFSDVENAAELASNAAAGRQNRQHAYG